MSGSLSLSAQTHTLLHAYAHTLSLGYYQDKSIWSIQGSGCHFIHIFSSLVTLLKATASIYPEWMNAPTDETQGKMRPTQLGMTTACHFQTCSQIPCFICNRKNSLVFSEPFGTMFSIHLRAKRQSAACMPSNDKRMAVETSSLGGKKWDVTVSECAAWRKLETRQKCVYLCQLVSWPSSRPPLPSVRREN